jgi:hypothetical protein
MTQFTPVNSDRRLWLVEDLLDPAAVNDILAIDWPGLARTRIPQQHFWLREQVEWNEPRIQSINQAINSRLPEINQALGTEFTQAGGVFWIDYPGFVCHMHTDGHLKNAMQLYWLAATEEYGTGFYNYKREDSLLYQFRSRTNTGYIMLNDLDASGAQPLQWHAMLNPVPEDTIRVTSYWQFK